VATHRHARVLLWRRGRRRRRGVRRRPPRLARPPRRPETRGRPALRPRRMDGHSVRRVPTRTPRHGRVSRTPPRCGPRHDVRRTNGLSRRRRRLLDVHRQPPRPQISRRPVVEHRRLVRRQFRDCRARTPVSVNRGQEGGAWCCSRGAVSVRFRYSGEAAAARSKSGGGGGFQVADREPKASGPERPPKRGRDGLLVQVFCQRAAIGRSRSKKCLRKIQTRHSLYFPTWICGSSSNRSLNWLSR